MSMETDHESAMEILALRAENAELIAQRDAAINSCNGEEGVSL